VSDKHGAPTQVAVIKIIATSEEMASSQPCAMTLFIDHNADQIVCFDVSATAFDAPCGLPSDRVSVVDNKHGYCNRIRGCFFIC
jgi:hypothetical protein